MVTKFHKNRPVTFGVINVWFASRSAGRPAGSVAKSYCSWSDAVVTTISLRSIVIIYNDIYNTSQIDKNWYHRPIITQKKTCLLLSFSCSIEKLPFHRNIWEFIVKFHVFGSPVKWHILYFKIYLLLEFLSYKKNKDSFGILMKIVIHTRRLFSNFCFNFILWALKFEKTAFLWII